MNGEITNHWLLTGPSGPNTLLYPTLFQATIHFAQRGFEVLYLATERLTSFPLLTELDSQLLQNYDVLNCIVFVYVKKQQDLLNELLELHSWKYRPRLIVIDSIDSFEADPESDEDEINRKVCLNVAALHNGIDSLRHQSNEMCYSLVTVSGSSGRKSDLINLLTELYFYCPGNVIKDVEFSKEKFTQMFVNFPSPRFGV